MSREWTIAVRVVDHGPWRPDDEKRAADLIRVINNERRPQDGKPRVEMWAGKHCLSATIDTHSFTLDPGEHLVATSLPDGSMDWGGMDSEYLAKLGGPA